MFKKLFLAVFGLVVFFNFNTAHAQVAINEIMYDLDGADIDYVEIVNQGSTDVDLSTLKLLISNSTSNHTINFSSGSSILHSLDFGIITPTSSITNYTNKWGSTGNIFTSSFSLPNTSAIVEINPDDKTNPISSMTYDSSQGASGDGNSLQLISGAWMPSVPTPGIANQTSSPPPSSGTPLVDNSTNNDSYSNSGDSSLSQKSSIKTKITAKNIVFVGIPLSLKATAFGYAGEELHYGKYFWNFGDGSSREIIIGNTNDLIFTHTYLYPGDYSLSMEYYLNSYSQTPDAVNKIKIKVVPLELSISKVGDVKDFYVELTNNSLYDIDVSNWQISSLDKVFTLPRNSNILAKNKIILSSLITHFTIENKNSLKLITPTGQIVSEDNSIKSNNIPVQSSKIFPKPEGIIQDKSIPVVKILETKNVVDNNISPVAIDNLLALAVDSNALGEDSNRLYIFVIILVVFLFISGGVVYFIRQRSVISKHPNDFEILDE